MDDPLPGSSSKMYEWADGEPFTADDVVFTFEYVTNPDVQSTSAPNYATVESVEALDDYTRQGEFQRRKSRLGCAVRRGTGHDHSAPHF